MVQASLPSSSSSHTVSDILRRASVPLSYNRTFPFLFPSQPGIIRAPTTDTRVMQLISRAYKGTSDPLIILLVTFFICLPSTRDTIGDPLLRYRTSKDQENVYISLRNVSAEDPHDLQLEGEMNRKVKSGAGCGAIYGLLKSFKTTVMMNHMARHPEVATAPYFFTNFSNFVGVGKSMITYSALTAASVWLFTKGYRYARSREYVSFFLTS
jgi:hypothetical protein